MAPGPAVLQNSAEVFLQECACSQLSTDPAAITAHSGLSSVSRVLVWQIRAFVPSPSDLTCKWDHA